jgi:hypothetical protein
MAQRLVLLDESRRKPGHTEQQSVLLDGSPLTRGRQQTYQLRRPRLYCVSAASGET